MKQNSQKFAEYNKARKMMDKSPEAFKHFLDQLTVDAVSSLELMTTDAALNVDGGVIALVHRPHRSTRVSIDQHPQSLLRMIVGGDILRGQYQINSGRNAPMS